MQLWELIAADVESGARELVSEYGARLFATAYRICGNEKDAEDLVQRTFVRVVERIGSFNGRSAFFTWMCAILVNFHRMDRRGKARNALALGEEASADVADPSPDPAGRLADEDEAVAIRRAVAQLPELERETVVLHYFNGFSVPEIARMQKTPEGTVYYRLHQARAEIRGFLAKVFGPDGIRQNGRTAAR